MSESFHSSCCVGFIMINILLILISVIGIIIGLFIFLKPERSIKIQKKFYEKINWRIEPISMKKEIRNTKIMGMSVVVVAIATIIYCCVK